MQVKGNYGTNSTWGADPIHLIFLKPAQLRGLTRAGLNLKIHISLLHPLLISGEGGFHREGNSDMHSTCCFLSFLRQANLQKVPKWSSSALHEGNTGNKSLCQLQWSYKLERTKLPTSLVLDWGRIGSGHLLNERAAFLMTELTLPAC